MKNIRRSAGAVVATALLGLVGFVSFEAAAQTNQCATVLLCPDPSSGGKGGTGGAGGSGGSGGTGAVTPAVTRSILKLDKTSVSAGQTITGTVSFQNNTSAPVTLRTIVIATRAPGTTNSGGPFTDMAPTRTDVTLAPKGIVKLTASRTITGGDPVGKWRAYSTYQDSSGKWHDAGSLFFQVTASAGGGGGVDTGGGADVGPIAPIAPVVPVPPPSGRMTVGAQEWFVTGGGNNWAGTNIYASNVNWATAYSQGTNIWNPQFLAELRGYSTFRHMDTNAVNWSRITSWSQRKLPTDPRNADIYIDSNSAANTTGMAVEWQIDLCNRANVDCWFTHPYLADDNYMRQQAQLIRSKLNSGLKIYIELSNEVWNGTFGAFNQAIQAGEAQGLPGGNQYYRGIAHEMYRALQMFQIYQEVFGASAMGSRVIRVFSESGNLDLTTQALNTVYRSSRWNPSGQKIDMMALAPYVGHNTDGASESLSRWRSEVDQKVSGEPIETALTQMRSAGIPLLGCYEAGMHHMQNAHRFSENPISYDAYLYMLDRFATKMNAPCNLYTLHGTWGSGGAWGLYSRVGQPLSEAHKARAVRDWINRSR